MLMRKLAIYKFASRNILYLIFQSIVNLLSVSEKISINEMLSYSKIGKHYMEKIIGEKEKDKKKGVCLKHQCRNDR